MRTVAALGVAAQEAFPTRPAFSLTSSCSKNARTQFI